MPDLSPARNLVASPLLRLPPQVATGLTLSPVQPSRSARRTLVPVAKTKRRPIESADIKSARHRYSM